MCQLFRGLASRAGFCRALLGLGGFADVILSMEAHNVFDVVHYGPIDMHRQVYWKVGAGYVHWHSHLCRPKECRCIDEMEERASVVGNYPSSSSAAARSRPLPPATLQPPRVPNLASSSSLTDDVIDGWIWPTRCSEGAKSNYVLACGQFM
ncbi:hypothetical protein BKA82DRAFT_3491796 [Pisolithus tinctorius]|nr:hypothetical protein BKA82DRAFT_3491796 [Pisolithus tinctorius]